MIKKEIASANPVVYINLKDLLVISFMILCAFALVQAGYVTAVRDFSRVISSFSVFVFL